MRRNGNITQKIKEDPVSEKNVAGGEEGPSVEEVQEWLRDPSGISRARDKWGTTQLSAAASRLIREGQRDTRPVLTNEMVERASTVLPAKGMRAALLSTGLVTEPTTEVEKENPFDPFGKTVQYLMDEIRSMSPGSHPLSSAQRRVKSDQELMDDFDRGLVDMDRILEGEYRMQDQPTDMVNHPPHYTTGGIETIDYIEAKLTPEEFRGYCKGSVLKYSSRAGKKGDADEDLKKARWYLNRLIGDTDD
jgi:hypothetical protein